MLGLTDREFELALWTAAASLAWLLAVGVVYLIRRPREPPVGRKTNDLGPEPPAIANFLTNGFRVSRQAMPATLLDLAARDVVEVEERGLGVYYVRLRPGREAALTPYEQRVLEHVRQKASDGVVPVQALTTGPAEQSKAWWRGFQREVVEDAKARGLSRDALDRRLFSVLTAAAVVPAIPAALLAEDFEAGFAAFGVALVVLGWVRARHPQRETAKGLDAGSRWLGVRAALAENEEFRRHSPLTVELWERLLAYGAALGVATAAAGPLTMGTESDTRAWTAYGGRWREVRVAYPSVWPIAWGTHPLAVLAVGSAILLASGFLLQAGLWEALTDIGGVATLFLLVPCSVFALGTALAVMALLDLTSSTELSGPILRLRVFGDEDHRRLYVALDDGTSSKVRALRVRPELYVGLAQGEVITARATKSLRYVKSIAKPGAAEPPQSRSTSTSMRTTGAGGRGR